MVNDMFKTVKYIVERDCPTMIDEVTLDASCDMCVYKVKKFLGIPYSIEVFYKIYELFHGHEVAVNSILHRIRSDATTKNHDYKIVWKGCFTKKPEFDK